MLKIDSETTYFRVDNIKQAINKIIKYLLVIEKKELYLATPVVSSILKSISKDKKIVFIGSNYNNIIKKIANKKVSILISTDVEFTNSIFKNCQVIDEKNVDIISSTMFKSSFIYNNRYFDSYKVPPHYVNDFVSSVDFCKTNNLLFDTDYGAL